MLAVALSAAAFLPMAASASTLDAANTMLNGGTYDMVGAYFYGETFTPPDVAGSRSFTFVNNNAFSANALLTSASVNALAAKFTGGLTMKWLVSGLIISFAEADISTGSSLSNLIAAGGSDTLRITFGDPIQRSGDEKAGKPAKYKTATWNVSLFADPAPVPLPAGGLLLLAGLGGLAALRRRTSV